MDPLADFDESDATATFATPSGSNNRLDNLKGGEPSSPFDMSPKQTKLLARLHVLMRSFKELKMRVQTMQAAGAWAPR